MPGREPSAAGLLAACTGSAAVAPDGSRACHFVPADPFSLAGLARGLWWFRLVAPAPLLASIVLQVGSMANGTALHRKPSRLVRTLVWGLALVLFFLVPVALAPVSAFWCALAPSRYDETWTDMRVIEQATALYMAQTGDRCPMTPRDLVAYGVLSDTARLADGWGSELSVICAPGEDPVVGSAGPDRRLSTSDDLWSDGRNRATAEARIEFDPAGWGGVAALSLLCSLVSAAARLEQRRRAILLERVSRAVGAVGMRVDREPRSIAGRLCVVLSGVEIWVTHEGWLFPSMRLTAVRLEDDHWPLGCRSLGIDVVEALSAVGSRYAFRTSLWGASAVRRGLETRIGTLAAAMRALCLLVGRPGPHAPPYR